MNLFELSLKILEDTARLGLETAEAMVKLRKDSETVILNRIQDAVKDQNNPPSILINKGLELTFITLNRHHELEYDIVDRLYKFLDEVSPNGSDVVSNRDTVINPTQMPVSTISVTAHIDEEVIIPMMLRNHHDVPQNINLRALPPQQKQGVSIPVQRIQFFPAHLVIPERSGVTAYAVIDMKFATDYAATYLAEVLIGGSEPRRLAIQVTIDPTRPVVTNEGQPIHSEDDEDEA